MHFERVIKIPYSQLINALHVRRINSNRYTVLAKNPQQSNQLHHRVREIIGFKQSDLVVSVRSKLVLGMGRGGDTLCTPSPTNNFSF